MLQDFLLTHTHTHTHIHNMPTHRHTRATHVHTSTYNHPPSGEMLSAGPVRSQSPHTAFFLKTSHLLSLERQFIETVDVKWNHSWTENTLKLFLPPPRLNSLWVATRREWSRRGALVKQQRISGRRRTKNYCRRLMCWLHFHSPLGELHCRRCVIEQGINTAWVWGSTP